MNKSALSTSNIYIENAVLTILTIWHQEHAPYVGDEINAVKNREEGYGRYFNAGMDFTC
jgi:hypothetical protein